jgi:hypothetical protein
LGVPDLSAALRKPASGGFFFACRFVSFIVYQIEPQQLETD